MRPINMHGTNGARVAKRNTRILCFLTWCVIAGMGLWPRAGTAAEGFSDDFKNPTPIWRFREPVSWRPAFGGNVAIDNESLIVSDDDSVAGAATREFTGQDVMVETQVRILQGTDTGLGVRWDLDDSGNCYFVSLSAAEAQLLKCGPDPLSAPTTVDFDVTQEDVVMQLQVVADTLSFWAWPATGSRPADPLLTAQNSEFTDGFVGAYVNGDSNVAAAFRYFNATVIPEPSSAFLAAFAVLGLAAWRRGRHGEGRPTHGRVTVPCRVSTRPIFTKS